MGVCICICSNKTVQADFFNAVQKEKCSTTPYCLRDGDLFSIIEVSPIEIGVSPPAVHCLPDCDACYMQLLEACSVARNNQCSFLTLFNSLDVA